MRTAVVPRKGVLVIFDTPTPSIGSLNDSESIPLAPGHAVLYASP
ncbi:conserved protein of unknown function [Xenorhabdus doucetiae]|uniref:Uncharacterized protein n=1 Tax=Xenorhabdus doucetiae TaxID=351671 RepID=A0A068QRW8_9GAMM|nr:conserved protein of unknown function [Xenorhabdus doucetiae]